MEELAWLAKGVKTPEAPIKPENNPGRASQKHMQKIENERDNLLVRLHTVGELAFMTWVHGRKELLAAQSMS